VDPTAGGFGLPESMLVRVCGEVSGEKRSKVVDSGGKWGLG
jgi:hypothetical protein